MNQPLAVVKSSRLFTLSTHYLYLIRACFAGLLIPLGFAPFHLSGLSILGIALLYAQLQNQTLKQSFLTGFVFGLGFLGFGVSWVYVSIHEYGHLNWLFSGFITLVFVVYLAIYPGLVAFAYTKLVGQSTLLMSSLLFSALWCLGEYLRSTVMTGFPWLLLGFGQIDSPLKFLLPIVGVYGVGFIACLASAFLISSARTTLMRRYLWLLMFIGILVAPSLLRHQQWATISKSPVSVGVIQANLSMRDKWNEALFWTLLDFYRTGIDQLMGEKQLIVLPESAIPLPASYVSDIIDKLHVDASNAGTSILLGIPEPTSPEESYYYNSVLSLGSAKGKYLKQHLVPFGEFIPQPFAGIVRQLGIPFANLKPGSRHQSLIHVHNHPIASLICYELAYPELLRKQLPEAEWIVSISDDGWFGHSLAMYQQLQMAQVLSLQTGRYQVVANNDGLSSIINTEGSLSASLPAFSSGILEANLYPATGLTPWVYFGDKPALMFSAMIILGTICFGAYKKRRVIR